MTQIQGSEYSTNCHYDFYYLCKRGLSDLFYYIVRLNTIFFLLTDNEIGFCVCIVKAGRYP